MPKYLSLHIFSFFNAYDLFTKVSAVDRKTRALIGENCQLGIMKESEGCEERKLCVNAALLEEYFDNDAQLSNFGPIPLLTENNKTIKRPNGHIPGTASPYLLPGQRREEQVISRIDSQEPVRAVSPPPRRLPLRLRLRAVTSVCLLAGG